LIKFSENLAEETVGHNISVFALHPGLLTIGMTETLLASQQTPGTPSEQVANWFRRQIAQGRAVAPERAAEAVVALASGRYAPLSGCYLTVDDDLDVLAARAARDRDPHLNRLRLAIAGAALQ
jgi:NAD(P)-dependent dehydrogenase (short-subunit alcohol dehydrogenase family)